MKQEDLSKIFEDEKESEKLLIYQHDRGTFDLIKRHIYNTNTKSFL